MADTTYATVGELKGRVSIAADDTGADDLLQQVLNAAAELVDGYTQGYRAGYEAFSESEEETRVYCDEGIGFVSIDPALTVSAVSRDGAALDPSAWQTYPSSDGAPDLPITGIVLETCKWSPSILQSQISVTGTWGYCSADDRPAVVKEATLRQAAIMVRAIGGMTGGAQGADQVDVSVVGLLNGLVRRSYVA